MTENTSALLATVQITITARTVEEFEEFLLLARGEIVNGSPVASGSDSKGGSYSFEVTGDFDEEDQEEEDQNAYDDLQ